MRRAMAPAEAFNLVSVDKRFLVVDFPPSERERMKDSVDTYIQTIREVFGKTRFKKQALGEVRTCKLFFMHSSLPVQWGQM